MAPVAIQVISNPYLKMNKISQWFYIPFDCIFFSSSSLHFDSVNISLTSQISLQFLIPVRFIFWWYLAFHSSLALEIFKILFFLVSPSFTFPSRKLLCFSWTNTQKPHKTIKWCLHGIWATSQEDEQLNISGTKIKFKGREIGRTRLRSCDLPLKWNQNPGILVV